MMKLVRILYLILFIFAIIVSVGVGFYTSIETGSSRSGFLIALGLLMACAVPGGVFYFLTWMIISKKDTESDKND